jgi:hypothetical protein
MRRRREEKRREEKSERRWRGEPRRLTAHNDGFHHRKSPGNKQNPNKNILRPNKNPAEVPAPDIGREQEAPHSIATKQVTRCVFGPGPAGLSLRSMHWGCWASLSWLCRTRWLFVTRCSWWLNTAGGSLCPLHRIR